MIAGLSKAVTLHLAHLLGLTATLLALFTFLSPTLMLHDRVALLKISSSTTVSQAELSKSIDGPSVWLGILGSCAQANENATLSCTLPALSPVFDLDVLPESAPTLLLNAPSPIVPIFIAVALAFSTVFLFTFTCISLRHKMPGKVPSLLEGPAIQNSSAWIGVFGFLIGFTAFLVIRMWYGKTVKDFNASIVAQGETGPQLIAGLGNGFTMIYVAYAFYAVPIISSLTKLNVKLSN